ncbi:Alpha/Beta hydrolase protein [Aspergillus pseudonomiae]|uniref:Alpha/Beta hydrolase protein n=1 Tax=Aspergillus pseudonomiae TaxID=1506151 RepID=A0A5N7D318_9EURO|nr:Alpha/Beta hydrolase protein [Aspergillus pseudonomiae]KAE8400812.1 Alpha/Beta hydrolase protein [Aspergillus pseudonomiae]
MNVTAAHARYPGFNQTTEILKNGTIRRHGARPLTTDILFHRDVPVKLRDNVTMYTDIYRPVGDETLPAIVAWSPYGKEVGGQWLDDITDRDGVPLGAVSELQKFGGPDPAYWVQQGYAVLNPDARGADSSEGNTTFWGRQLAEDGYDFVEWAAEQDWCSGEIGMSGNSWLAISQWFIAAQKPPHLSAIAPWEALTDMYRDSSNRGGIAVAAFNEEIITTFSGPNYIEDVPRMTLNNQLMNIYWEDKMAQLDNITLPAYVVASYTNAWLRVHNTSEWYDYYRAQHMEDLNRFFDHYLKDKVNGWESTPRIRLAILDPGHGDELNRPESEWPLSGMQNTCLYLHPNGSLSSQYPTTASRVTQLIGYMNLRLWVQGLGSDDMELAITVQKTDASGNVYNISSVGETSSTISATGYLRVSARQLDKAKSTPAEPYYTFDREQLLLNDEVVLVEIGISPMAMRFYPGEHPRLTVAATEETFDPALNTAIK